MRLTATAVGVIVAAVVSSGVTSSATAPSSPAAAPAAAPAAVCQTHLGTFDQSGNYRKLNVSSNLATVIGEGGNLPGAADLRTLGTGSIDYGDHAEPQPFHDNWHLATSAAGLYLIRAQSDSWTGEHDSVTAELVAPRWGGFRHLVQAGQPGESVPNLIYGLHDNGALYRYRLSWGGGTPSVTSYGSVAGFGDLRTMTLISRRSGYDTLLATTTTGQLTSIRIPTTATMTATRSVIRTRTWGALDQLAIEVCDSGTMLVAINSATDLAYAYHLGLLNGTGTPITSWGQLQGQWAYRLVTNSFPFGTIPRGA
ncbi:hypothetical protein [Jiangella anatolica]|uniref:hypothetical protein n=1 Tax=Jiangella anatolica TaxID=2670374 RepID=UPI0011B53381|nr:hypothetical protein [Jiangella anatolica]